VTFGFGERRLALVVSAWALAGCAEPLSGSVEPPTASARAPLSPSATASVPELSVVRVGPADTIVIDGKLDEPLWGRANSTGPFGEAGSGKPVAPGGVTGRARLAWDDAYLYFAVEVTDAKVRGGFPADARDPHLWERDTVELMLDPDGDGDNRDYYELQVNPQNLVFDSQFDSYNAPRKGPAGPFGHEEWSSAITSAVLVKGSLDDDRDRDDGYVVEAKLPWASLTKAKRVPPRPGDAMRANLYAMENNGGAGWSPILGQGNFHRASRFGRLVFAAK
jgi:hypothetical protein